MKFASPKIFRYLILALLLGLLFMMIFSVKQGFQLNESTSESTSIGKIDRGQGALGNRTFAEAPATVGLSTSNAAAQLSVLTTGQTTGMTL